MDKKIIDKIKKCLALASSSNPNEAATALRQAQILMAKHGVTGDDLELSEVEVANIKAGAGKTPPQWIVALINLVRGALGVEVIYTSVRDNWNSPWTGTVEFIGVNGLPEIAGYTYEVLLRQLKKGRSEFLKTLNKKLKLSTKIRRGDLYAEGWIESVNRQTIFQQPNESVRTLIDKWMSANHPDVTDGKAIDRTSKARQHDAQAYYQGKADGKKVVLNHGVRADQRDALTHQGV